jgi:hypothetical protein
MKKLLLLYVFTIILPIQLIADTNFIGVYAHCLNDNILNNTHNPCQPNPGNLSLMQKPYAYYLYNTPTDMFFVFSHLLETTLKTVDRTTAQTQIDEFTRAPLNLINRYPAIQDMMGSFTYSNSAFHGLIQWIFTIFDGTNFNLIEEYIETLQKYTEINKEETFKTFSSQKGDTPLYELGKKMYKLIDYKKNGTPLPNNTFIGFNIDTLSLKELQKNLTTIFKIFTSHGAKVTDKMLHDQTCWLPGFTNKERLTKAIILYVNLNPELKKIDSTLQTSLVKANTAIKVIGEAWESQLEKADINILEQYFLTDKINTLYQGKVLQEKLKEDL